MALAGTLALSACGPAGVVTTPEDQVHVLQAMTFARHPQVGCLGLVTFGEDDKRIVTMVPAPDRACPPAEFVNEGTLDPKAITLTHGVAPALLLWQDGKRQITLTRHLPADVTVCIEGGEGTQCALARTWQQLVRAAQ